MQTDSESTDLGVRRGPFWRINWKECLESVVLQNVGHVYALGELRDGQ